MRMIYSDKLIEEIESYRGDVFASEIVELIEQFPTTDVPDTNAGEWIPANQPPNVFDEHNISEDLLVKLKWDDGDVTYCVGFYSEKYGWSEDSQCTETIAWMPLPWIKLSDLYHPEGGTL